jgi:hypothetical protein
MYKIFPCVRTIVQQAAKSTPFINSVVKMSHSRAHSERIVPLLEEKFSKVVAKTKKIPNR